MLSHGFLQVFESCAKTVSKCPKLFQRCLKAVPKLFQSCTKDVAKLYQICLKVVSKLSQSCTKDVSKLSQSCFKDVSKLFQSCTKVVSKMSQSCTKVVAFCLVLLLEKSNRWVRKWWELHLVIFHPATRMEVKTRQSMVKSIAMEQTIPSLLTWEIKSIRDIKEVF